MKTCCASNSLELFGSFSFQEKKNRRQTHQAFTPGLFQAKLAPAMALPPTTGTRPIRTHTTNSCRTSAGAELPTRYIYTFLK
jgi:hypothetical protein